ncbi:MAG: hypothetical protein M3070_12265 [Actinomycetota bacterium]|nr:hypothetical protein [Actinomycetota bacterium]
MPALQKSPFLGGYDFLGAARERIFLFTNGPSGKGNPEAQGLNHVITDGLGTQDASLSNKTLIDTLANQDGDTVSVLGDFPSSADPRHANAYIPLGTRRSANGARRRSPRSSTRIRTTRT